MEHVEEFANLDIEYEKEMLQRRLEDERNFFRNKYRQEDIISTANLSHRVLNLARKFDSHSEDVLNSLADTECRNHEHYRELELSKHKDYHVRNEGEITWRPCSRDNIQKEMFVGHVFEESPRMRDDGDYVKSSNVKLSRTGVAKSSTIAKRMSKLNTEERSQEFSSDLKRPPIDTYSQQGIHESKKDGFRYTGTETARNIQSRPTGTDRGQIRHENSRKISHQDATRELFRQAIENSDFALLKIMLRMSPQVKNFFNDKDNEGNYLIHRCCRNGNHRLATVLIEIGIDINIQGEKMRTPLHMASHANDQDIVRLLLNSCADLHRKDDDGLRPVDMCTDPKVKTMLLRRMSTRSRSFNRKISTRKHRAESSLSRTDSGFVNDQSFLVENEDKHCMRDYAISSYKALRFARETVI